MCKDKIIIEIIKSPLLSAAIAGITATIISPYIKWGIEKRKMKLNQRKELVKLTRAFWSGGDIISLLKFCNSETYHKIRFFFPTELNDEIIKAYNLLISKKSLFTLANPGFINIDDSLNENEKQATLQFIENSSADAKREIKELKEKVLELKENILYELAKIEKKWNFF